MELIWLLDRSTAIVAYSLLYVAVLTGVFYNTPGFGDLYTAARRVHIPVSVLATIMMLSHALVGLVDAWLIVSGSSPAPSYPIEYFIAGVVVGGGALLLIAVAVLGFIDRPRFRGYDPRVIHWFAYAGFGFSTLHALAIGSDMTSYVRTWVVGAVAFLVYVLVVRAFSRFSASSSASDPR